MMYRKQAISNSGFSLLEVMIASVILIIALTGIVEMQNQSSIVQRKGEQQVLATDLAGFIMERLAVVDFDHALLDEVDAANSAACHEEVLTNCVFDHGSVAELDQIFEVWDIANNLRTVSTGIDSDGIPFVWYEGFRFFVGWNVNDNTPFGGTKQFSIHVRYEPYESYSTQMNAVDYRMRSGL